MSFLEDIIYVNKSVLEKSIKNFSKNWMLIFAGLAYALINFLAYNLFGILFDGPISILSGIIWTLFNSSIVSDFLYLLFNIVSYNRLTIDNFKYGFTTYMRKIYIIFFVGYIGRLLLSIIMPGLVGIAPFLNLLIFAGLAVVLNALPETVYLKEYDAWESILYAVNFLKENFINWALPNLVFYGAIYFIAGELLLDVFNTNLEFTLSSDIFAMLRYALGQIIFSFMMIYRGNLYRILSTSTRRKRTFMKKI